MSPSEPTIQQLFDLSGKVAVVTGGAGHIGTSFSKALAEVGASVVVTSRSLARARELAGQLPKTGQAKHLGVELDHTDIESIDRCFDLIIEEAGQADILVNNGHEISFAADWTNVTAEQFNNQMANATGYFLLARKVRDHAVKRSVGASIIMVGSMYGVVGSYPDIYEGVRLASPVAYQTVKGGIIQMTRHLAVYWARDGIRVNCISPGPSPTGASPKEMVDRLAGKSPMHRTGHSYEFKGILVLLASEAGSYITGQNILVDGGWTAW